MLAAFAVALFTGFDVIYLILIGGVLGVIYTLIAERASRKKALPLEQSERLDDESNTVAQTDNAEDNGGEEQ